MLKVLSCEQSLKESLSVINLSSATLRSKLVNILLGLLFKGRVFFGKVVNISPYDKALMQDF